MKRKKPNGLIAVWKDTFSREKETAIEVENTTKQTVGQENGANLVLIRKTPVTFRLSRLDNPEDFERMSFVIKAIAKDGDTRFKTVLHVERIRRGSRLIASDGLRLHVAEITKRIKSGNYKPHVTKDVITLGNPIEGIKYPSWSKVIPEKTVQKGIINLKNSSMGKDRKETEKLSLAFNDFLRKAGEPVNLRYLEDLTKQIWVVFCRTEKHGAILLKEKNGYADSSGAPMAVIMPIRQAA